MTSSLVVTLKVPPKKVSAMDYRSGMRHHMMQKQKSMLRDQKLERIRALKTKLDEISQQEHTLTQQRNQVGQEIERLQKEFCHDVERSINTQSHSLYEQQSTVNHDEVKESTPQEQDGCMSREDNGAESSSESLIRRHMAHRKENMTTASLLRSRTDSLPSSEASTASVAEPPVCVRHHPIKYDSPVMIVKDHLTSARLNLKHGRLVANLHDDPAEEDTITGAPRKKARSQGSPATGYKSLYSRHSEP